MADADAFTIYSVYNSMVYLMALPGGWIADRLLGTRRSVLWGGIVIAAGHYVLALPVQTDVLPRARADRAGHRSAQAQHLGDGRRALRQAPRAATSRVATPASRCSTWASTSVPSSPRCITGYYARNRTGYHLAFGIAAVGMTLAVDPVRARLQAARRRRAQGAQAAGARGGAAPAEVRGHSRRRRRGVLASTMSCSVPSNADHIATFLALMPLVVRGLLLLRGVPGQDTDVGGAVHVSPRTCSFSLAPRCSG